MVRAQHASYASSIIVTSPPSSTSAKLPDPPVYEGKANLSIDDWLAKIRTKLTTNHDHYNTEPLRIGYIQNQVRGEAIKHLTPHLHTNASNAFTNTKKILTTFKRIYGDPNRKQTTTNALRKLYQNKDFFYKF